MDVSFHFSIVPKESLWERPTDKSIVPIIFYNIINLNNLQLQIIKPTGH